MLVSNDCNYFTIAVFLSFGITENFKYHIEIINISGVKYSFKTSMITHKGPQFGVEHGNFSSDRAETDRYEDNSKRFENDLCKTVKMPPGRIVILTRMNTGNLCNNVFEIAHVIK